jgi:hypothetical protein
MAFSIEKLKAAFVRVWNYDEPEPPAVVEPNPDPYAEFWSPTPNGLNTLPVNANTIVTSAAGYLHANGHIGQPPFSNVAFSNVVFSETEEIEVEESTESEIANMAKVKEPERKRFKTIAMAPPAAQDVALAITSAKDFRVFYSKDNEIAGIGETDTLDNAKLMVRASQYGPTAKERRKVDLADKGPHIDVVDRNATIVRQYALV